MSVTGLEPQPLGTFGLGMFNCKLAAGMLGGAAAQTTAVIGEVTPSDVPALTATGLRQPAGVIPGSARPGRAAPR
jgi:hypothetical protein